LEGVISGSMTISGSMAVNAALEEAAKITSFVLIVFASNSTVWQRILYDQESEGDSRQTTLLLFPLLCITAFAVSENVLYFLSFPTSSIYRRLLYSFPIHLNTALLYALGVLSGRVLRLGLYLIIGVLYHLALNHLSIGLSITAVYLVGATNVAILSLLYWRLRMKIIQRSIRACWNPK
jgi:hypothetical protein